MQRHPFAVPDDTDLRDPAVLTKHLLDASAYFRGSSDGIGFARLLEAAAQVLQQQEVAAKVQRGLTIASQTLASELRHGHRPRDHGRWLCYARSRRRACVHHAD